MHVPDDVPPRRLGPYRIEGVLGRGGMGEVYAAFDERLGRRVAVKRVLTTEDDPQRRRRLLREARTAAQLSHPAVVQVFDLLEEANGHWIVMELVEGQPLSRHLEAGPLPLERGLEIARGVAEGLASAHALGIVHRDLKTQNVMVLPDGRVKILDFGLAKRLVSEPGGEESVLSITGQVMGTGRAMSPEQARGLEVGPASDLFSLGVLLYEMLGGVSPFLAESFFDTLTKVVSHQPPPLVDLRPEVPEVLSELVERLLQKAPDLRPISARAVAGTLAELLDELRFESRGQALAQREMESETWYALETHMAEGSTPAEEGLPVVAVEPTWEGHRETNGGTARRKALAASLAATLLLVLGWLWVGSRDLSPESPTGAPQSGASQSDVPQSGAPQPVAEEAPAENPLRLFEEGMEAVRRIDRPEETDRALDIFQRLLATNSRSAPAHAGLARAFWEKARNVTAGADPVFYEQAETAAREAVRLDPYLADARVSLGLVELFRGEAEEATRQFEHALELDPTNADAHYGLAKAAERQGEAQVAEEQYRQAIALRPLPLYYDSLGALHYSAGRYPEAEENFQASLELRPDNVYALRNLGAVLYAAGRLDEAASRLQEALKIRPEPSLYTNLGVFFYARGLYARAVEAFEHALELSGASHDSLYWNNLADAYRMVPGREEEARDAYRRTLELLDKAVAAAPEFPRQRSRRALALARSGNCDKAAEDISRVLDSGEHGDVYATFRIAISQELCGDREMALEGLERALRAGLALSEVHWEPDLLALRAAPRFQRLVMDLMPGDG